MLLFASVNRQFTANHVCLRIFRGVPFAYVPAAPISLTTLALTAVYEMHVTAWLVFRMSLEYILDADVDIRKRNG